MTTLRVALDASQMIAQSRQVVSATQDMGQAAQATGRAMTGLDAAFVQTARAGDATRETLRATSGAIQSAGNVRQLVDALKQVDGSFATISNVAAIAAQTVLSFARAADDFRQMSEATGQFTDAMQLSAQAVDIADDGLGIYGATATAATTAINAQGAATTRTTAATGLFTRATLALRAAWAAHPVLLIGSVLAAAATAMAAFGSSTRKTADDTAALAEQQRALEQSLKSVQRIRAEGRLGEQFGIAGAADTARRRERETVFQQAVEVEQGRLQGRGNIPLSTLGAAGTPEDILNRNAQLNLRFERAVQAAMAPRMFRQETEGPSGTPRVVRIEFTPQELATLKAEVATQVRSGFTVGYDEAIQILQGRFDEIGQGIQQAAEAANQQAQPSSFAQGFSSSIGRVQAQIDAEVARQKIIEQINAGIAEETRLAGLSEDAREREIALLQIKQKAAQQGVILTEQELANIEAQFAARDQQSLIAAENARLAIVQQISAGIEEENRLAGLTEAARERELALLRVKQEASQQGIELTAQELANIEAQFDARDRQALIDAEAARVAVLQQISAGIEEENRLAGLTEAAREREIALLRIKQDAAQQGVQLSAQELANIEAQLAARDQQAALDAEVARRAVIEQINAQLSEEVRLVGLTENAREREVELLRIKQDAAQQGVELTQQELNNIEAQLAARQRQAQLQRQAQFNVDVVEPSREGLRMAGYDDQEREVQAAIASARAQAENSGLQLQQAEEERIRSNVEAMQQMEMLRATGQEVGSALGNAFVNAATGVGTLRQALAGLLQDLIRIAAQRAILGPLANAFGGLFANLGGATDFGTTSGQASYDSGAASQTYRGNTLPSA